MILSSKSNSTHKTFPMEFIKRINILLFVAIVVATSCSEDTGYIGVLPENENLATSMEYHGVYTSSKEMDSVVATSTYSYLGQIYDPETKGMISSSFATQFSILEGERLFPACKDIETDFKLDTVKSFSTHVDSVLLTMAFDKYYGDYNTPLKLAVYPINPAKPLSEDSMYYTSTDLEKYIDPAYKDHPLCTQEIAAYNRTHSTDPLDASSSNWPSIRIPLPKSVGENIMTKWYAYASDKNNHDFDDSYHFIHNVNPGYYVKIIHGNGTLVRLFLDNLYVFYNKFDIKYTKTTKPGDPVELKDTTIVSETATRFAGTPEVIQTCHYSQSDVGDMLEQSNKSDSTWIKTPAGICTVVTLNVDSVMGRPSAALLQHKLDSLKSVDPSTTELPDEYYRDAHYTDSISRIQFTLQRYNKDQDEYHFGIPQNVLLLPESQADTFFVSSTRTADAITTYVTTFNSTYNCYEFSNIGRLYSALYRQRDDIVRDELLLKGIEAPTYRQIYEQTEDWLNRHQGWDNCDIIPVETTTDTSSGSITSINHDLGLSSACLVRGTAKKPIKIQVFYVTVNNTKIQ